MHISSTSLGRESLLPDPADGADDGVEEAWDEELWADGAEEESREEGAEEEPTVSSCSSALIYSSAAPQGRINPAAATAVFWLIPSGRRIVTHATAKTASSVDSAPIHFSVPFFISFLHTFSKLCLCRKQWIQTSGLGDSQGTAARRLRQLFEFLHA
jgi:hypothetical protein